MRASNNRPFCLEDLRIASPCDADWNRMPGDERVRFCEQCQLQVYDLSAMTRAEAMQLVTSREGGLCVRLFRRTDGTVLTRDCPRGLRALRWRTARLAAGTLGLLISLLATPALASTLAGKWSLRGGLVRLQAWLDPPVVFMGDMGGCPAPPPANVTPWTQKSPASPSS